MTAAVGSPILTAAWCLDMLFLLARSDKHISFPFENTLSQIKNIMGAADVRIASPATLVLIERGNRYSTAQTTTNTEADGTKSPATKQKTTTKNDSVGDLGEDESFRKTNSESMATGGFPKVPEQSSVLKVPSIAPAIGKRRAGAMDEISQRGAKGYQREYDDQRKRKDPEERSLRLEQNRSPQDRVEQERFLHSERERVLRLEQDRTRSVLESPSDVREQERHRERRNLAQQISETIDEYETEEDDRRSREEDDRRHREQDVEEQLRSVSVDRRYVIEQDELRREEQVLAALEIQMDELEFSVLMTKVAHPPGRRSDTAARNISR